MVCMDNPKGKGKGGGNSFEGPFFLGLVHRKAKAVKGQGGLGPVKTTKPKCPPKSGVRPACDAASEFQEGCFLQRDERVSKGAHSLRWASVAFLGLDHFGGKQKVRTIVWLTNFPLHPLSLLRVPRSMLTIQTSGNLCLAKPRSS